MKKILITTLILVLFFGYTFAQQDATCKDFAKSGLTVLDTSTYVHDGHYNTVKLLEGDKIDIYKPFYKGRKYKVVAMSDEQLPGVNITIKNVRRQEMFKSENLNSSQSWEYVPERTENLIISVEIPANTSGEKLKRGCVSVLIGFTT